MSPSQLVIVTLFSSLTASTVAIISSISSGPLEEKRSTSINLINTFFDSRRYHVKVHAEFFKNGSQNLIVAIECQ